MPFKPLSNALLSPYKVPFGVHLYNYLITKNLRWLLSNPFFHPSPTFTLHILSIYFDGWWGLGGNGFYKVHCESTHHQLPSPNIQPHTSSSPTIQHPSPQHSTPHIIITQHPTPITQHSTSHIIITQHPTPITQHSTPLISLSRFFYVSLR